MDVDTRIKLALGKLLKNFNFLELNLGLCIRFFGKHVDGKSEIEDYHPFLKRSSFPEYLERLKKLIDKSDHVKNSKEYKKWIAKAEKLRKLRNHYIHAIWQYYPDATSCIVLLTIINKIRANCGNFLLYIFAPNNLNSPSTKEDVVHKII